MIALMSVFLLGLICLIYLKGLISLRLTLHKASQSGNLTVVVKGEMRDIPYLRVSIFVKTSAYFLCMAALPFPTF